MYMQSAFNVTASATKGEENIDLVFMQRVERVVPNWTANQKALDEILTDLEALYLDDIKKQRVNALRVIHNIRQRYDEDSKIFFDCFFAAMAAYEATLPAGQTMSDSNKSVYLMNALTDQKKEKVAILMDDRDTWAALQDAIKSLFRVEALSGKTKNPAVIGNTSESDFSSIAGLSMKSTTKPNKLKFPADRVEQGKRTCCNCEFHFEAQVSHRCPARGKQCNSCGKGGHFACVCRNTKSADALEDHYVGSSSTPPAEVKNKKKVTFTDDYGTSKEWIC
uniref:CCHC-type domain-containing protein n=1 Tax=Chromera velia CCMP2878 TaxID=1169474 RepID=A0A0G4IA17_9ALVE|eukprot:Cvel_12397.t1-p1 / transcript=Cvel_12397.t1 / gene=Cvel_12397 / organism=Chromera_velia_CCMP2878 / gene_product=hypothetical protein / transcript_product=hypothetical protein / location=Cvel_scaffold810:19940-20773(-) / protein_length=278 / sequence_SO=supercontig / SO=protein_coding / is_pseudo=false